MKRQKPTTFSSEMYQKALQEISDLRWNLSLREAAWAAAEEVDRQKSERIHELESHRSELDCRYAGQFADFSGSHCPLDRPCERCLFEKRIRELEAALSDLVAYCKDGYGDHEADEVINATKLLEPPQ